MVILPCAISIMLGLINLYLILIKVLYYKQMNRKRGEK